METKRRFCRYETKQYGPLKERSCITTTCSQCEIDKSLRRDLFEPHLSPLKSARFIEKFMDLTILRNQFIAYVSKLFATKTDNRKLYQKVKT